jgi:NTP pyrophosphatase (non-canonical NTP hydrolase)
MSRQAAMRHPATLAEIQSRVDTWIHQFEEGYWPPLSMLARLTEEVGELARELNHRYGHKPKKDNEPAGDVALEVADIIFVLVCLCNSLGIDLGDSFERVMHKYDRRDGARWTRKSVAKARDGTAESPPARRETRSRAAAPRRKRRVGGDASRRESRVRGAASRRESRVRGAAARRRARRSR